MFLAWLEIQKISIPDQSPVPVEKGNIEEREEDNRQQELWTWMAGSLERSEYELQELIRH